MGVDARILFEVTKGVTDQDIAKLGYDLGCRFPSVNYYAGSAIEARANQSPSLQVFELRLIARYYGKGYERGPIVELVSIYDYLRLRPSVTKVWYTSDAAGFGANDPPTTTAEMRELLMHFFAVGHAPCHEMNGRACWQCGFPAYECGWGPAGTKYRCPGCRAEETVTGLASMP